MIATKSIGMMMFCAVAMTALAGGCLATAKGGRPASGDVGMAAKIAIAKTAADHEAIAAQYGQEAATAREEAARHDRMGASYTGALKDKVHLDEHCRVVANRCREQAKDLDALAEAHRAQAKAVGK